MATTAIPLTNNPGAMNQLGNVNSPKFARAAVLFLEFCRKKALLELLGGKKTRQGKRYRQVFKYFLNYLRLRGQQGYFFDPASNDNVNGFGDPYSFGFANQTGVPFNGPQGLGPGGFGPGGFGPGGFGPGGFGPGGFGPGVGPFKSDESSSGDCATDSHDDDRKRCYQGPYPGGYPGAPHPGFFPGYGYPQGAPAEDGDGFLASFSNPLLSNALFELFDESDSDSEEGESERPKSSDEEFGFNSDKKINKKRAIIATLLALGNRPI